MEQLEGNRKVLITFIAVALVAIVVVAAVVASPKKNVAMVVTTPTPATTKTTTTPATSTSGSAATSTYKNGSYTATGSYNSPGGTESVTVHVTLANDVITASSVTSGAQDPQASEYQSMFIGGYKSQVVGKKIASVHLSRVSGSSLTSQGFNEALAQIESQAKA